MSWKDKLKENNGTDNGVKLNSVAIQVKRNESGEVKFCYWDKENTKNVFFDKIEGVLIGQAMKLSAFSNNLGRNGGQYVSSYYFNNNDIVVYGEGKAVYKGNYDGLLPKLHELGADKPSKKKVLFVKTKTALMAIENNLVIAIDKLNQLQGELTENTILLTAKEYDPTKPGISPKAIEYLGKFAVKNHPLYADISVGQEITDVLAEDWALEESVDLYSAWKAYRNEGHEEVEKEEKEESTKSQTEEFEVPGDDDFPF